MDPEQVAIDAGAVKMAKVKRFGRAPVFSFQTERNIPAVYERPGRWPTTKNMANLPSVVRLEGPSRTVHAQSQSGSSWNLPPFTGLWPQGPGSVIAQVIAQRPSPLLDLLSRR